MKSNVSRFKALALLSRKNARLGVVKWMGSKIYFSAHCCVITASNNILEIPYSLVQYMEKHGLIKDTGGGILSDIYVITTKGKTALNAHKKRVVK